MSTKLLLTLLLCAATTLVGAEKFDVVVYGGTAGGAMSAVSAARRGLKVVLIEPGSHIGGMVSGGLSYTDFGKKDVIGGYPLEFYMRVGRVYEMNRFGQPLSWYHEPHIAEEIFRQMLQEAGVVVREQERLRASDGVRKNGTHIASIAMENGHEYEAGIFIDAGYEGDLMAAAKVRYVWGRESSSEYGESLAGVRTKTPFHQFLVDIPAHPPDGKLWPEIQDVHLDPPGSADKKVQAYNFRMCFADDPTNQVAFEKPANYDPKRYQLLALLLKARAAKEGHAPALSTLLKIDPIPNHKADVNNQGAFSTDYIGGSWQYPTADYAGRDTIWQNHKRYQQGLFYFLANDPQVPAETQAEMRRWGLCKDEFTDTEHWPFQIYIRESRRMVGEYVAVQKDLQTDLTKPDAIGMGSYNSDSHNIERIVDANGFVRNEGDMQVPVVPYQIPFRIMLPKSAEATNLLVPVAFSASHVAYSSLRMEPQYMMLGQAAGLAAKLALEAHVPVQKVDVHALQSTLVSEGTILQYSPSGQEKAMQIVGKHLPRKRR